jgi:tRNA G10  N-methylase Trm11
VVNTGSATDLRFIPNASIDYVFTDPPFGDNLAYAELNFQVEAFYGVFTKIEQEAIVSNFQGKQLTEYKSLMRRSFEEFFRVLKPGRWMTVVFSNTKASVWNGIQTALQEAGFVIADVSSLDKQQGSFNDLNATSVKQDLASAYKPTVVSDRFKRRGNTELFGTLYESS